VLAIDTLPALPRTVADPPGPPVPNTGLSRWTLFLGEIAAGTPLETAMLTHRMRRADIEAHVRAGPSERERWTAARLAAKKRRWSAFDLEEIFAKIAGGMPIGASIEAVRGGSEDGATKDEFAYLCAADPDLHEQYMSACKSRALVMSEEIITIADGDGTGDYLDNGKGGFIPDNAKVNRDKLRADTRKALMGSWFPKVFGEKKGDTQVNIQFNHAERLEQARQRRDGRSSTKATPAIIEAAFRTIPGIEGELPETPVENSQERAEWDDVP
jgi:hypothetical protein